MPYIVTTKRLARNVIDRNAWQVVSRRAVDTLEEARERALSAGASTRDVLRNISESGGTVGPLPDGTVIEVEQVTWAALDLRSSRRAADYEPRELAKQPILDAFNAKASLAA
jgi:hypothetical protein